METFQSILKTIGIILLVLVSFNIIIFVHELGHFLAARWRGLQIDRFQIWFGKPIWKKTINGVQYGLGSIPAGGFVALPQMAPMEAIEGENEKREVPLKPIKPIDKIIVAAAGPLFSFLLALVAAIIVWKIGIPDKVIKEQTVGFILKDGHAEKAGFQLGDEIIKVNGEEVDGFTGNLNSIRESIIFSEGEKIKFTVLRKEGKETKEVVLTSAFDFEEGSFLKRRGVRKVGFAMKQPLIIESVKKDHPASVSDFKKGDVIEKINGEKIWGATQYFDKIHQHPGEIITVTVTRDGKEVDIIALPTTPDNGWIPYNGADPIPLLGINFAAENREIKYPSPGKQLKESASTMWTTLSRLVSPSSSIGLDQMNGPVGIGKLKYQIFSSEHRWRYIFYFWVIFNINLAIFNLLPFPVLDGGHITMAVGEMIRKKPMNTAILEKIQIFFVLLLLSMFVFVTIKDLFGEKKRDRKGLPAEPTFVLEKVNNAIEQAKAKKTE